MATVAVTIANLPPDDGSIKSFTWTMVNAGDVGAAMPFAQWADRSVQFNGTWGAGMLQIGAPIKAAVDDYMKDHEGHLPPGVETSSFTRVNIKRG